MTGDTVAAAAERGELILPPPGIAESTELAMAEAELADSRRYDEWLALWCCESTYWAPYRPDADPDREVSIIFDDADRLRERIDRLKSGVAWAQVPPTRTVRILSGFRLRQPSERSRSTLSAKFIIIEAPVGRPNVTWAGDVEYTICGRHNELRICRKTIHLVNIENALPNMTFII